MSWRIIVISSRAKLDLRFGYMVVRGEKVTKIHLAEISTVIVASTEVSLTAALLAELVKLKIKIIFCDNKSNPTAELVGYYGAHDTALKLRQQLQWTEQNKICIWTAIVAQKINNQSKHLLMRQHIEQTKMLEQYLKELVSNDVTNREGHAAKVYFNALFGTEFTRSNPNNLNAALNYGYTILLSAVNREIVANGYITPLGLHHANVFNYFNLGSDIMEPLRPFIDYWVYELWNNGKLPDFEPATKMNVIAALNQTVQIEEKNQILNYAVGIYCKSIFDALNEQDVSLIKFPLFAL